MSIAKEAKTKMDAAIEHVRTEMKGIRSGKADPGLVDGVSVEIYGAQMRLRDVANVTTPEPRQLLITPYDATSTAAIGKAIEKAGLNLRPVVEANCVRINIPPMDGERRQEMVKLSKKRCEDGKIVIRNIRRDCNDQIKKQKTDGLLAEDQVKKLEKEIQDLTDKYCKDLDEIAKKKEQEILAA